MIQVTQQRARCIGCNACVEAAEYRWRMSRKDGKCTLIGAVENKGFYTMTVDEEELADLEIAARTCPVNIIKVKPH